jgi:hypothetical protein
MSVALTPLTPAAPAPLGFLDQGLHAAFEHFHGPQPAYRYVDWERRGKERWG